MNVLKSNDRLKQEVKCNRIIDFIRILYTVNVLYADVIVTCTDGSQWKLDCFFFADYEDVQLRLVSLDNDNELEADGCLEDLTTKSLSNIEKYLELLK